MLSLSLLTAFAAETSITVTDFDAFGDAGSGLNDTAPVDLSGFANITSVRVQGTLTTFGGTWTQEIGVALVDDTEVVESLLEWGTDDDGTLDVDHTFDFSLSPLPIVNSIEAFATFDDGGTWNTLTVTFVGEDGASGVDTSFVESTISGTPGFGGVIGSSPAFSTANIGANLADDYAELSDCFELEQVAGTFDRARSPRVQGAAEFGGSISGASLTNGTIDGTAFTADISPRRLTGQIADGSVMVGTWTRVNNRRTIFYGVRAFCFAEE